MVNFAILLFLGIFGRFLTIFCKNSRIFAVFCQFFAFFGDFCKISCNKIFQRVCCNNTLW